MGDSTFKTFRNEAGKYALGCAIFAAVLLGYIRTEFVFQSANRAAFLVGLVGLALLLTLILGILGLPKLESFVALFIFTITGLFFVYGPLYMVP